METATSEKNLKDRIANISNQKLLFISLGLIILNSIFMILMAQKMGTYNLDGTYNSANSSTMIINGIVGFMISFPVVCLFLAFITTVFMNKDMSYKKRYLKGYLFTLIILNTIIAIRLAYNILQG